MRIEIITEVLKAYDKSWLEAEGKTSIDEIENPNFKGIKNRLTELLIIVPTPKL